MFSRVLVIGVALALSAGAAHAQTTVTKTPIKPTSAADAQEMFVTYCAACHGKDGKGDGPAAGALNQAPADLTRISARNGGAFPEVRVRRFIEGLDEVKAHGTRDMPIWGDLFRALDRNTAQIRIEALAQYLKGLQQQ
jgi:mono/diheme cytochrome c family protein